MNGLYHDLRKKSPEAARTVVRKIFSETKSIRKTANILSISRNTVRRALRGPLYDKKRIPKNCPNRINSNLESLIVREAKVTGYRYKRLHAFLIAKYSIFVSPYTIRAVLRRNMVKKKKIRTAARRRRPLYDYEHLLPFQELQVDTKHILDKKALPLSVYNHIKQFKLPLYEYNIIDVATRMRFTAYSFELSALFGQNFIFMVLLWLRAHNIRHRIRIQGDNGPEFCSGSKRKLDEFNRLLANLNAFFEPIPPRMSFKNAIVENSHRIDDEAFFTIHPERCLNTRQFLLKAQMWQDTWNSARKHYGISMNGLTPLQKLMSFRLNVSKHVVLFPVLLLEHLLHYSKKAFLFNRVGQYVLDTCHINLYCQILCLTECFVFCNQNKYCF